MCCQFFLQSKWVQQLCHSTHEQKTEQYFSLPSHKPCMLVQWFMILQILDSQNRLGPILTSTLWVMKQLLIITPPLIGERSIVKTMSVCVCLSVCGRISRYTHPIFTKIFVPVIFGRSSVLLTASWYDSGFVDNVILAHKPRHLNCGSPPDRSSAHVHLRAYFLGRAMVCASCIGRTGHVEYPWHHVFT